MAHPVDVSADENAGRGFWLRLRWSAVAGLGGHPGNDQIHTEPEENGCSMMDVEIEFDIYVYYYYIYMFIDIV